MKFEATMLRSVICSLLICLLFISICCAEDGLTRCNCDEDGTLFSVETIMETQKVSDFLIAVAYFSIPLELIYFVSCSNVPFKWVLVEFIAFIVLCGLTHLLNGCTYGPHSFRVAAALTAFKSLTALVSCATAITLITLFPLLLKVKVREFMLRKKAWDLGREVGIIMRQNETGLHVRMLTREIRKSLDRHTILYTTLVELSKALQLQNCAVWMPNEGRTEMNLTHELKPRTGDYSVRYDYCIPTTNFDVARIKRSEEVSILNSDSALACLSGGAFGVSGPVAAIRVPMLRVSNFKGGTPELIETCYAILVCVLPFGEPRNWTPLEVEIVKVVADQVAVALSHAAILEESQLMREKLVEQNRVLQCAKHNALMASQARMAFEGMMCDGMRRPVNAVSGLLSTLQNAKLSGKKGVILDAMVKANDVLSLLINDALDISRKEESGKQLYPLRMKRFSLRSLVKETACLVEALCIYQGFGFFVNVDRMLPDHVIGNEIRVIQVILHVLGNLLIGKNFGGAVEFRVLAEKKGSQDGAVWRENSWNGFVNIRFEFEMVKNPGFESEGSAFITRRRNSASQEQLTFRVCQELVKLMQGSIWIEPDSEGYVRRMSLILRFQLQSSISILSSEFTGESSRH